MSHAARGNGTFWRHKELLATSTLLCLCQRNYRWSRSDGEAGGGVTRVPVSPTRLLHAQVSELRHWKEDG